MPKHPEAEFLHQRDPKLHTSPEVEHVAEYLRASGEKIANVPADKIAAHVGFLANKDYVNDGILTGDQTSIDRQVTSRVIKPEDVPEGYFDLQRRIAREQGHGGAEITPQMRGQLIEAVQAEQRGSLEKWVEYIGGDDGGYPDWFKTYTWNSVTKLADYDKEKNEFRRRSTGTTAPYPELNREALAYVYDKLNKHRVQGQSLENEDEKSEKLLRGANFGKLYAHAARETAPAPEHLKAETRGSWTMFHQSDDPRTARRLAGSLRGHGTGWCTAGESTAAMQLQGGDFYVYYTRDEDGKDTVPRVAIRMEEGTVAEVRGINAQQELEPAMTDITLECLKDLDGGEAYIQKAEDMKRLTSLEKRLHDDPSTELSKDDIIFLYELDHDIQGFGYERDPRIDETKELRGARDYVVLKELAVERIRDSFPTSYQAYQNIAEQLGLQGRYLQKEAIKGIFEAKLKQWQETGVIDYVAERIISHGEVHTPVMTPNVLATGSQIKAIAQLFGEGQPYETYIDNSLYNQYSPEELCRPPGYDPMRIGLMPTSYDKELTATVETQLKILRDKQLKNPELKLRVPSVLEALVYWQILRERGYKLDDDSAYEKTFIRHFNLEPATDADFWRRVPNSRVYNTGKPHLYGSDDIRTAPSRLLIG